MRKNHVRAIVPIVFIALTCCAQQPQAQTSTASSTGTPVKQNYGRLPLLFESNQGQTDSQVKFLSQGPGYSVFLTSGSMVLSLRPTEVVSPETSPSPVFGSQRTGRRSAIRQMEAAARARKSTATSFVINLVGSSAKPQVVGEEPLPTKVNYFIGRDPKKWRTNVPTYARVRYRNVYPGIDVVYYGNNRSMEYDFDLAPGADATQIQFAVNGADALNLDSTGNLVLSKGASEIRFQSPILYQEIKGIRTRIPGTYVLRDSTHVGFEVGNYDTTKPLVIDPVLVYSSFLGGSGDDFSNGIAVDSAGDAYEVGLTDSPTFPLAIIGSYSPTQFRMFLTKLNPAGSALLFADYFGGTSGGDEASAIALDSSGNAYVTGCATSSDFPVV
ncbi:MAG TPA: SBBP repeat-containing protein, partial [Candidatus Acidoferrum sp.]|nr:SBBP repeat-containing protein [Candidatus Acidoferrum sp.]